MNLLEDKALLQEHFFFPAKTSAENNNNLQMTKDSQMVVVKDLMKVHYNAIDKGICLFL